MKRAVCIDGALVAPERAKISVYDRGFLYGDGAFEVLRTYGGVPFALEEHLERLARSAATLRIKMPAQELLVDDVRRVLAAAKNTESYVRVMLTRGDGLGLAIPDDARARRVVLVEPLTPPAQETYDHGVRAISVKVPRAHETSSAKLLPYIANILALEEARSRGASDALFVDPRGAVLEGATSNVFIVRGDRLTTPSEREPILAGITRGLVIEVALSLELAVDLDAPSLAALYGADEVFLTSSIREIVPVIEVDDRKIGTGRVGHTTRALHRALRKRIGVA